MEQNKPHKYLVSNDGMFYRHEGAHWYRHGGKGDEHEVVPENAGLLKVKNGEAHSISEEQYLRGIDPDEDQSKWTK